MIGVLQDILYGILDIPFLIVSLLVEAINGWIMILALFIEGLVALLPSFPELPTVPGGLAGSFAWVLPVAGVLAVFTVMLVTWVSFMAIKIALNWGKVKM